MGRQSKRLWVCPDCGALTRRKRCVSCRPGHQDRYADAQRPGRSRGTVTLTTPPDANEGSGRASP